MEKGGGKVPRFRGSEVQRLKGSAPPAKQTAGQAVQIDRKILHFIINDVVSYKRGRWPRETSQIEKRNSEKENIEYRTRNNECRRNVLCRSYKND